MRAYIIGNRYSVPCVEVRDFWGFSGWIPIIGPWHEDASIIGFLPHHYHVDWRFVTDRFFKKQPDDRRYFGKVIKEDVLVSSTVKIMKKKCRRRFNGYPRERVEKLWLPRLEASYGGDVAKCGICPHRGLPLDGLPVENGVVTCPGHGLRICSKSLVVLK